MKGIYTIRETRFLHLILIFIEFRHLIISANVRSVTILGNWEEWIWRFSENREKSLPSESLSSVNDWEYLPGIRKTSKLSLVVVHWLTSLPFPLLFWISLSQLFSAFSFFPVQQTRDEVVWFFISTAWCCEDLFQIKYLDTTFPRL